LRSSSGWASSSRERGYPLSRLAIAWVLSHPAVQVAIVGSRSRKHIEESLGAAELTLSDEDEGQIEQILADAEPIEEATPETMTELMGLA
jgi:aryl-alcohol dehydrogenase-like predicted oxidoreductase